MQQNEASIHYVIHFYLYDKRSRYDLSETAHDTETLVLPSPLLQVGQEFLYDFRHKTGAFEIEKIVPHLCQTENYKTTLKMHVYARPADQQAFEIVETMQEEHEDLR